MTTHRKIASVAIFICLWMLFPCLTSAQQDRQARVDSLRNALNESEGIEKLRTYGRLANIYYVEAADDLKMDTLFTIYDAMEAEAKRQEELGQQGAIAFNRLSTFYNRREYDEVISRAPACLDFLDKHELWRYFYPAYRTLITTYHIMGEHENGIREARKLYQHAEKHGNEEGMAAALYAMAYIYIDQDRNREAEENLRQCIELLKDKEGMAINELGNAQFYLCQLLMSEERLDEALELTREYEKTNQRYESFAQTPILSQWGNLWGLYVRLYTKKEEFDLAETYCNKLDSLMDAPTFKVITYTARARIANHRGQYKEAIRLMSEPAGNNLSIDGIGFESGFNDRKTFHRIFKQNTGVTPGAFRRLQ